MNITWQKPTEIRICLIELINEINGFNPLISLTCLMVNLFLGYELFDYIIFSFIGSHDYAMWVRVLSTIFLNKWIFQISLAFWIFHFFFQYPLYHVVR